MTRFKTFLSSVFIAALIVGCDSTGLSGEDLSDVQDTFDCTTVRSLSLNSERNGTLDEDDCEESDFAFDIYTFRLTEDSDVEIEAESDDFDLQITLYDDDPDYITQDFAPEGREAEITIDDLDSGVYVLVVASEEEDATGDYRVIVTAN